MKKLLVVLVMLVAVLACSSASAGWVYVGRAPAVVYRPIAPVVTYAPVVPAAVVVASPVLTPEAYVYPSPVVYPGPITVGARVIYRPARPVVRVLVP